MYVHGKICLFCRSIVPDDGIIKLQETNTTICDICGIGLNDNNEAVMQDILIDGDDIDLCKSCAKLPIGETVHKYMANLRKDVLRKHLKLGKGVRESTVEDLVHVGCSKCGAEIGDDDKCPACDASDEQSERRQEGDAKVKEEMGIVAIVYNNHVPDSGHPPCIDTHHLHYVSIFENSHGEQWVYFVREKGKAFLAGGDIGWAKPHEVIDGAISELILDKQEATFLAACWIASKPARERGLAAGKKPER